MICDKCGTEENVIRVVKVIDGRRQEVFLCEKCLNNSLADEQLGSAEKKVAPQVTDDLEEYENLICDNCGLSWAEILESGYLGCEVCYESFEEKIEDWLLVVQGASKNRQKQIEHDAPEDFKLTRLKLKLREAIAREDFEVAARLRDQIAFLNKE